MFLLYGLMAGVIAGWLWGGSLSSLASLRLRWWPLAIVGLAIQLVLFALPVDGIADRAGPALHVVSVVLVLAVVAANLRLRGLWIVAAGGLLNLVVIGANGGTMPATPDALAAAGVRASAEAFENSAPVRGALLAPLGDVFAIPAGIPFANVFSVGDVVLAVGTTVVLACAMRPVPATLRCRQAHGPTDSPREYQ